MPSIVVLALLLWKRAHRDKNGKVSRQRLAGAVVLPATLYAMVVCIVGHFFLRIPVSSTISNGFGDERIAWLLVALSADVAWRIWGLFGGSIE